MVMGLTERQELGCHCDIGDRMRVIMKDGDLVLFDCAPDTGTVEEIVDQGGFQALSRLTNRKIVDLL